MLRSNHNTWPVDVSQIKQGFIVVKGHSTVRLQLTAFPGAASFSPMSLICFHTCTHSCPGNFLALSMEL